MSTKLADQCYPLHQRWGAEDCCLCRERKRAEAAEARVKELEARLDAARKLCKESIIHIDPDCMAHPANWSMRHVVDLLERLRKFAEAK